MRLIRILAQLIDLFVCFAALMVSFVWILPALPPFSSSSVLSGILVLVLTVLLAVGAQLPFLKVHQTVGKAFFGLVVAATDSRYPVTLSLLLQRELFCKLMSCYLICIPVLFGKPGGHEVATRTKVVRKAKRAA